MGKRAKSNLSLHRLKRVEENRNSFKPQFWTKSIEEILPKTANYENVTKKITLQHRCRTKTFTPVKKLTVNAKKPTPRSRSIAKRLYLRSPFRHNRQVSMLTPSKSPVAKKSKKSLADSYSINHETAGDKEDLEIEGKYQNSLTEKLTEMDDSLEICGFSFGESSKEMTEIVKLLPQVLDRLSNDGFDGTILQFFRQMASGEFPVHNIAFLLWTEVVKWHSCKTTTEMRYSEATKKFWKLGYRLFGGRFVCFMSGFKNSNQVVMNDTNMGFYSPTKSEINFAVPDIKILREFQPYELDLDSGMTKPGISQEMIKQMANAMKGKSCCITFDGKKLKPGLTRTDGDVDLFGFEKGSPLMDRKRKLDNIKRPVYMSKENMSKYQDCIDTKDMTQDDKTEIKVLLMDNLKTVSSEILDITDLRKKKEYAKDKMIQRSEGDWKNSKYVYGISAMIAFIHEIDEFLGKCYELIEEIIAFVCYLNDATYIHGKKINLEETDTYHKITNSDSENQLADTRKVKQRSDSWFERRKLAKVTGSTIFKAIGLDGVQKQKEHFDNVVCGVEEKKSENTQNAMKYGTDNEPNAAATFVGKVMPLLFPGKYFCEEGFVQKDVKLDRPFMIISPDGSVRSNSDEEKTEAAVEFKCPLYNIHHMMPERYLLQCLSEIEALDVNTLLYLCWRPDFSSLFIVRKNGPLFNEAYELAKQLYDTQSPKRPTKALDEKKQLKAQIAKACQSGETVEFIGLIPSLCHDETVANVHKPDKFCFSRLNLILQLLLDCYDTYFELKREKASEAVVFLCCDLDREWDNSKIRCAPVCWFTKGYSLDTDTIRNILEAVLDACKKTGLHIPAVSFDGQWHNIAVRDSNGYPLTILQLQKDLWKQVEGMPKTSILNAIKSMNTSKAWYFEIVKNEEGIDKRVITCTNKNATLPVLSERVRDQRLKDTKRKEEQRKNTKSGETTEQITLTEEHPESERDTVSDYKHSRDMAEEHTVVVTENLPGHDFENNVVNIDCSPDTAERCTFAVSEDISEIERPAENNYFEGNNEIVSAADVHETDRREEQSDKLQCEENGESIIQKETINLISAASILSMFKTDPKCNNKEQWNEKLPSDIQSLFTSHKHLNSLRDVELKIVVRYLKKMKIIKINESQSKQNKVEKLCEFYRIRQENTKSEHSKKPKRVQNVKSLSDLSFSEISKGMKKTDLNIIHAEYLWDSKITEWRQQFPICVSYPTGSSESNHHTDIEQNDIQTQLCGASVSLQSECETLQEQRAYSSEDVVMKQFFYSPSFSESRQQIEVSCIDSSHLLTRTRRKICKGGIDGISNTPWRKVAKSKITNLSLGMIDCVLEPMSVPVALSHFSERVEMEMRRNGDHKAADLCSDIRLWWKAEDDPGFEAVERINMRMPLRNRLLKHHNVAHFPPPGMYVAGWPVQLWEALIANIDAKILLYYLSGRQTYNVRAFSSMMGETFFSELTLYDRRGHGTVTSTEFGQFIQGSLEKIHMRLDPERSFSYRTARNPVYKLVGKSEPANKPESEPSDKHQTKEDIQNHPFDTRERTRLTSKRKEETINSDRNAVQRGALGVRWENARRNESKLLLTTRLGLDLDLV